MRAGPLTKSYAALLCALSCFCAPWVAAKSSAGAPQVPGTGPRTLTVLPQDGVVNTDAATGLWSAGEWTENAGTSIQHVFAVKNATADGVTVQSLRRSCGCTNATLSSDAAATASIASLPYTVAPGATVYVTVSVDPAQLLEGKQVKSVWLYGPGSATPLATVEADVTVKPAVIFTPGTLDFGTVPVGGSRTLLFTVAPGGNAAATMPVPEAVPQTPDLTLRLGDVQPLDAGKKTYVATFAPKRAIGNYRGEVHFGGMRMVLSVQATSKGVLAAQPSVMALGIVHSGTRAGARVTIAGTSSAALDGLKVTCTPYLTAKVVPNRHPGKEPSVDVEVTLDPKVPVGSIQAAIQVTAMNGQFIVIPVYAVVDRG